MQDPKPLFKPFDGTNYDPTKGMSNHFAGTSPVGPILGAIAMAGINTVARIWFNGKQTRFSGKNNGFNIS